VVDEMCLKGLVGRPEGKRSLGSLKLKWEDNIKMDLQEVGWGHLQDIHYMTIEQMESDN
jgi:hypothetical protein